MFQVDANHPTPLYAQLERSIRFAIATGKLRIGDQLPTVRQLAVDLRINANTVAKDSGQHSGRVGTARGRKTEEGQPKRGEGQPGGHRQPRADAIGRGICAS